MPLEKKTATVTQLHQIAEKNGSVYTGSTVDPWRRRSEHQYNGFGGTMYVARTDNMMRAEDQLLQHGLRHNQQLRANHDPCPGYVYVINGRKYS